MADDLLSTLCLATDAPVFLAPAMNRLMWANQATIHNCTILTSRGITLLGPDQGEQACGETGAGRMLEPEAIRDLLQTALARLSTQALPAPADQTLLGKHILLTAGPTREAIDPVRYISNHSSGKMGFAIAEAALALGAEVTLVAGPVSLDSSAAIKRIDVDSANEMLDAVMSAIDHADIFISVAAVSDYRLKKIETQKIKKTDDAMQLSLVRNPDILKSVANLQNRPFCVGFAAETNNVEEHARGKLADKKLDMIAANHVGDANNPVFGSNTNALDVYWNQDNGFRQIESADKLSVAHSLLGIIAERFRATTRSL